MSGTHTPWDASEWPRSAVGEITLPDGGRLPTWYCLQCEGKTAIEGRPVTPDHVEKYGKDAIIHICCACAYVREVAYPADAKGIL